MSETFHVGAPPTAPEPQAKPRPRRLWLFVAIGACVLVAAGVGAVLVLRGDTITVSGTLELRNPDGFHQVGGSHCVGDGGYSDIAPGAQVVITDDTGKTVGVGSLGAGSWIGAHCEWPFEVEVPGGSAFYGVEVSHRGRVQYPADRLNEPVTLSLGG